MSKIQITPTRPVYPSPAALITSVEADGTANIVTLGECFNVSIHRPVIVGIAIRTATLFARPHPRAAGSSSSTCRRRRWCARWTP